VVVEGLRHVSLPGHPFPALIVSPFRSGEACLAGRLRSRLLDQAQPPGDVARGRSLKEEGRDDREGDQGDRDLGPLDTAGEEKLATAAGITPKIGATTRPTTSEEMRTPGRTSRPRPRAVREITRSEMPTPRGTV
jgi:hypothetical protein